MRIIHLLLGGTALASSTTLLAAEQLKFGKPPEWVVSQAIPPANDKTPDAPTAILLTDQQIRFEPGRTVSYGEVAMKLQTAEGLAAGNVSLSWDPATDTVTVNKLQIRRGNQVIDVLASGQTFTTMRRETNLDVAMLDGILTANMQPEGLQQGDIIDLATTTEHVDPVLGRHVEGNFSEWDGSPIQLAHLHVDWPSSMPLKTQAKGFAMRQSERDGRKVIELTQKDVDPVVAPKGAPLRFAISRFGEATDLGSWADVATLIAPLYSKAETIAETGPLHDEVEKIRTSTADPKLRAAQALQLVQDRIRYVALLMGQGGYVPADAQTTWSRRFGDCKAKTALLLGILHSLGIEAEPILVQSRIGDAIPDRLPLLRYFDHVLVRAHVGGKTYFLDGTRSGDTDIDAIEVPDFHWGLPVIANAKLIAMAPAPRPIPNQERHVDVDATAGVLAPAVITLTEVFRGDGAVELDKVYSSLTAGQKDEVLRREAVTFFDGMQVGSSSVGYEKAKRQLTLTIKGSASLNWKDGWFFVPTSSIAFTPDFTRPAGPFQDAPLAVAHPRFVLDVATIKLPAGFAEKQKLDAPVHETLAGVEYSRTETMSGDTVKVESSERSLVPEVPYKDALAAAPRLKTINNDDVYLRLIDGYQATAADLVAQGRETPTSAQAFLARGLLYFNSHKYDQAITDFGEALKLEPDNEWALANRALAQIWLDHLDHAEKDLAVLAARNPDNPVRLRAAGLLAERQGDCAKGLDFFTRSITKDPDNNFALGHKAICESSLSKTEEALSDSEAALKVDPSWIDLRLLRANIFVRRGSNDLVAKEAELMTSENPQSAYAYIAAGKIYARLARTKEAMKAFDTAIAIKPDAIVYLNRAQSRPFTDRAGRIADLDIALRLDPTNTDVLAEKAEQLVVDGDLNGAKKIYDKVVEARPDAKSYLVRRAVLLFKTGNTDEARKELEKFRANANSASELNSLCWAQATAGVLLELALDECHDALKREPDAPAYLDSLALVELRLGKLDDAIADYTRAIAKNSGAASYMGRALADARKGNEALANADLRHALQLDPDAQTRFAEFGLTLTNAEARTAKAPAE